MDQANSGNSMANIRDPAYARSRIFIGNLPETTTRDELQSMFARYGNIHSVLVQKNFGFVQFETEAVANKAASATSGSLFKGNKITVRNAGSGKIKAKFQNENMMDNPQQMQQVSPQIMLQQYHASVASDYNDCEIIVVSKMNTEYAEYIEQRLKRIGLKVDILFPNDDVPIGKVLGNISGRGCLYAVLVTPQNEEHRSITVNILHGEPAEHRNMPVEDAIDLISNNFHEKVKTSHLKRMQETLPINLPSVTKMNSSQSQIYRHPDAIQALLTMLAENRPITVLQYDRVIKYLTDQRQRQVKFELGEDSAPVPPLIKAMPIVKPDPEIELQKKILSILNKPSITDSKNDLVYPTIHSLSNDPETIELLKDIKVQRALDSLMKVSSLVSTIESHYKF